MSVVCRLIEFYNTMIPIYTVFEGHGLREFGESTSVKFLDILGLPIIYQVDVIVV